LKINSEKSSGKNDACEISNTDFTPGSEIELINSEGWADDIDGSKSVFSGRAK